MSALWVPLILFLQVPIGLGLLRILRIRLSTPQQIALGVLVGLPLSSLVVLLLDIAGIRITLLSVLLGFTGVAVALNWPRRGRLRREPPAPQAPQPGLKICEWPFIAFFIGIAAISVWRAFYLPVTLRDAILGLDLVAKYAVEQGTLRSTIFTDPWLQGHLSNQPFYAPFPMLMQVVFRLAGLPFGQVWLSALFISFVVFFYGRLRESVHPLIAGVIMVLLLAVPEMYAHTFMVLNDYPTAVFFGLAMVFFLEHDRRRRRSSFILSALFLGFACWTRSDTIIFVPLGALLVAWRARRVARTEHERADFRVAWTSGLVFMAIPAAFVLLWHALYLGLVLRQGPAGAGFTGSLDFLTLPGEFYRTAWLFGQTSVYGYLAFVFLAAAIVNRVFLRDRSASVLLAWVAILYLGFVVILFAFSAASLEGTLKRGLFKFFPLMALYLGESRLLHLVSEKIERWEEGTAISRPDVAR